MQAGPCSWTRISLWCMCIATVIVAPCVGRPSAKDAHGKITTKLQHSDDLLKERQEIFLSNLDTLKSKFSNVKRLNYSVEEKREHIRKYKSLLELKGSFKELFKPEETASTELLHFRDQDFPDEVQNERQPSIYFPLDVPHPEDPHQETIVTSANLRLYKVHAAKDGSRGPQRTLPEEGDNYVQLYQLLPEKNSSKPKRKLLHSKNLTPKSLGWESFDITDVVKHWNDFPSENLGIEIIQGEGDIRLVTRNSEKSLRQGNDVTSEHFPHVKVQTETRRILGRSKRAPERYDCKDGDGEKRCCRYPLWVDFRDIGWDQWVLAPEGYQAYFCDGTCPDRYKPANNFAGIKSILHMLNPRAVPAPCCTASETDGLNLLHHDENGNLVVTEYEGMVVQDCKCV